MVIVVSDENVRYAEMLESTVGPSAKKVWEPTKFVHTTLSPELKSKLEKQVRDDLGIKCQYVAPDEIAGGVYVDEKTGRVVISEPEVKNIIQAHREKRGPRQGHWVQIGGERKWIEGQHNYNRQLNPLTPEEPILGTAVMNENPKLAMEGTMMRKCKACRTKYPDKRNAKCPGCGAKYNFVRFLKHDETIREGDGIFMKQLGMHVTQYRKLSPADKAVLKAANHLRDGTAIFFGNRTEGTSEVSTGCNGQCASEVSANAEMRKGESGSSPALASGGLA